MNDRYQPFIDAIWKSRRTSPPHPYTEQALHDLQESAEWKQLGRTQFAQRRLFSARESAFLGAIGNAVRLHYAAMRERGGLANLFKLMISPAERRKQFQQQQETQKQALRQRQAQSRNERAATLKAARRVELAKLSQEFQKDRETMKARHASEVAAQKTVWRQLAAEREKVWSDYRQEFAIKEPSKKTPASSNLIATSSGKPPREPPGPKPNRNTSGRPIKIREMEPTVHRPPKNQPGGTGAPDGRRRSAKPMELTKNETEAMMTAAVAGSAIGTSRIDLRQCLKTQNAVV